MSDTFKAPDRVCPYHWDEVTHIYQLRCERCGRTLYPMGQRAIEARAGVERRRSARLAGTYVEPAPGTYDWTATDAIT